MQTQTLNKSAKTSANLPLASLVEMAKLSPDQQAIIDKATQDASRGKKKAAKHLNILARAMVVYLNWHTVLRSEIWPMRRNARMNLTPTQGVRCRNVENNVIASWKKVLVHLDALINLKYKTRPARLRKGDGHPTS